MSRSPALTTLAATVLTGFTMSAAILLGAEPVLAGEAVDIAEIQLRQADLKASLGEADELATLEALQLTLTEVGDGSSYVWYRAHGRLSGVFQPTASFKDAGGRVCRHLEMMLTSGTTSRKTEGIACRERSGVWSLEG